MYNIYICRGTWVCPDDIFLFPSLSLYILFFDLTCIDHRPRSILQGRAAQCKWRKSERKSHPALGKRLILTFYKVVSVEEALPACEDTAPAVIGTRV